MLLRNWSDEEQKEIQCLQTKCAEVSTLDLEFGKDAGDPWGIIHNGANQTVVDVARIERKYVVAFAIVGKSRKRRTMETAVNLPLHEF
jgi:hypothetical protein